MSRSAVPRHSPAQYPNRRGLTLQKSAQQRERRGTTTVGRPDVDRPGEHTVGTRPRRWLVRSDRAGRREPSHCGNRARSRPPADTSEPRGTRVQQVRGDAACCWQASWQCCFWPEAPHLARPSAARRTIPLAANDKGTDDASTAALPTPVERFQRSSPGISLELAQLDVVEGRGASSGGPSTPMAASSRTTWAPVNVEPPGCAPSNSRV